MLKRYQVILDDWLATEAKKMAVRYNMSFSEIVRAALCSKYLDTVSIAYPQYKSNLGKEEEKLAIKDGHYNNLGKDKFRSGLSRLYFETQKAIEFVNNREAAQPKKQKINSKK